MWEGNEAGQGAGRRKRYTFAAACGPLYQPCHGRIKQAPADLLRGAEMVERHLAALDNTDCPSRVFLVHLQTP
jgi:hypothetical protein